MHEWASSAVSLIDQLKGYKKICTDYIERHSNKTQCSGYEYLKDYNLRLNKRTTLGLYNNIFYLMIYTYIYIYIL